MESMDVTFIHKSRNWKLEANYPVGSKKSRSFTFTGIDSNFQITAYNFPTQIRQRYPPNPAEVTEQERRMLRGLVGSLQYAAVHTRPDLSSSL